MKIGDREIADDQPPYVIAEIGVNHDGSVERGLELVDAAASAGAHAVKLQLFEADRLMSKAAKLAAYQTAAGESDPIEMLRRLELSVDGMHPIVERAHTRGIHAVVTVFSVELVEEAERLSWDAYKTASPDIVHRPLLERLMKTGRPLIVSTGASTMEEVDRAVQWLRPAEDRLAILQCVSAYPTSSADNDRALRGMMSLWDRLACPVGYSDHTSSKHNSMTAVLSRAALLEKHLTYSKRAPGPDHSASLEPDEMDRYVSYARRGWEARQGSGHLVDQTLSLRREEKTVLECERDVRLVSRQSIVLKRAMCAGDVISARDVTFKRPGTGLLPFELDRVIGRCAARDIEADVPIVEADLG